MEKMLVFLYKKISVLKLTDNKHHTEARYEYCQLKLFYHHLATYLYINHLPNFRI